MTMPFIDPRMFGAMTGGGAAGGLGGLGGLRMMAPQHVAQNPWLGGQQQMGFLGKIGDSLRTNFNRNNPNAPGENDIWKIISQLFNQGGQMGFGPMSLMNTSPILGLLGNYMGGGKKK